jgi:hypothetical protein
MDIVRRLVWFGIVSAFAAFAIFFVLGNFAVATADDTGPVAIRDVLSPGVHHLSGMLLLPVSCDELTVETTQSSATSYVLQFHTWQNPSVPCPASPTPRAFQTIVFAPSTGTSFTATLDGTSFPITILPAVVTQLVP